MAANLKTSARLVELLKPMTRDERALFLIRYAAAFGRAYETARNSRGYKVVRRKSKYRATGEPIGESQ